ncbi:MAG: hypothetical protein KKD63_00585 [Proteobacteria bacterium]|nr:hypothetical protein [Desulfobulbaceae bacterium]MBU4151354.1 hypothetical protein [Pseudomonadota bacterium]MDP2106779.1 hypothetical protein [Desulfobulbaceae bacterium]
MTIQHDTLSDSDRLLTILTKTAKEICRLEDEAKKLLYDSGDNSGYRDRMRQKAILLSDLADETAALVSLPPQIRALTQERIGSFSYEAERALKVDSVFYMAVLLCPEDHKDGMPNELDNFIAQLHHTLPLNFG